MRCLDVGVTNLSAGGSAYAKLRETEQSVGCVFQAPDRAERSRSFKLKAGESKVLSWPE